MGKNWERFRQPMQSHCTNFSGAKGKTKKKYKKMKSSGADLNQLSKPDIPTP